MIILTLRTDNPEAEVALFDNDKKLAEITWQAHRQLAETLHQKIEELLKSQAQDWSDIQGIACYQGPGSFTGLRIGLSLANALATSLSVAVVATLGDDWQREGISQLLDSQNQHIVLPEYGAPVHITQQKK